MGEKKLYEEHPAMFRNHPFGFLLCFLMVIAAAAGVILLLTGWLDLPKVFDEYHMYFIIAFGALGVLGLFILMSWRLKVMGTKLIITDERVTLRKGLLSKHTNDVYLTDVRNVKISQGFMQRLFGVGEIGIASAGSAGIEIHVEGIPSPKKAKDIIDNHRRKKTDD